MAQKSEEDRARDRAKNEKKVEKEKRRLEAEAAREASINTNHRNIFSSAGSVTVKVGKAFSVSASGKLSYMELHKLWCMHSKQRARFIPFFIL